MRALRQIRLETIFDVPALVNRVVNAGSKQVAPQSECFQPSPGSLRQRSAPPLAWKCKLRCALRVGRSAAQLEARGRRRHKAAEACARAATCRHALRCAPGQDHRLLGEPAQLPLKRQFVLGVARKAAPTVTAAAACHRLSHSPASCPSPMGTPVSLTSGAPSRALFAWASWSQTPTAHSGNKPQWPTRSSTRSST